MKTLVAVEGQTLRWYGKIPEIADNSVQFVQLEFSLPEDWVDLVVVAQFSQTKTYNKLLENGCCYLPAELVAGPCEVSLFGQKAGDTVRATSVPLRFKISRSGFTSTAETPIPPTPDLYAQLLEKLGHQGPSVVIDTTLTQPGQAADAKATGDAISKLSGQNAPLTTEQINALDGMFKVCTFVQADVSAQYNAFRAAFRLDGSGGETPDEPEQPEQPAKTVTGISAIYSGGSVPVGTAVSALSGIVVTAHYSDGSTETVTGYTMSGTIAEGENTITVTYQGKTATFTVTGVATEPDEPDEPGVPVEPGEVTMLTYIESDGNQIINTGVVPSFNHRYEFGLQTMDGATKKYFVGADEYRSLDSGTPGYMRMSVSKTEIDIDFQGQVGQQTYTYSGNTPYYAQQIMHPVATYTENDDGTITQKLETFADEEHLNKPAGRDGEKIISAENLAKKTMPTIPLYLFGINVSDKSFNKGKAFDSLIGRFAYFKVFDDTTGEKLHEFRAAKRGNAGGMYDVVNNVFCGNIGTGAFTLGEEVTV